MNERRGEKRKIYSVLFLIILCVSCAPPGYITKSFPSEQGENFSKVWVIRSYNYMGVGLSVEVILDNQPIAYLNIGEYIEFSLRPEVHTLGVAVGGMGRYEKEINFGPREEYYFLTGPGAAAFDYYQLTREKGQEWLRRKGMKRIEESRQVEE